MIIRQAIVTALIAMASSPTHKIVDAFVPTSILTPRVLPIPTTSNQAMQSISPTSPTSMNNPKVHGCLHNEMGVGAQKICCAVSCAQVLMLLGW